MKVFGLLKSKRGIALETAILFMIVIFSFCALITSLTTIGHLRNKFDAVTLKKQVEVQQIGEDYLLCVKKQENFTAVYQNYTYEVKDTTAGSKALTVKKADSNNVVLYVEARLVGSEVEVLKWCNGLS